VDEHAQMLGDQLGPPISDRILKPHRRGGAAVHSPRACSVAAGAIRRPPHGRGSDRLVGRALLRPIFNGDNRAHADALVGHALERLRQPLPKIAALLEDAEKGPLAFYAFPVAHWPKLRSTNPSNGSPRNRPPHRRRRHLPQRQGADPIRRQRRRRTKRRMARRPPLSAHSPDTILNDEREDQNREETREVTAA
jgi:hypothetical protein